MGQVKVTWAFDRGGLVSFDVSDLNGNGVPDGRERRK